MRLAHEVPGQHASNANGFSAFQAGPDSMPAEETEARWPGTRYYPARSVPLQSGCTVRGHLRRSAGARLAAAVRALVARLSADDRPQVLSHCLPPVWRRVRSGDSPPLFLDLPTHGKQVAPRFGRQRYRCTARGRTLLDPLTEMDERHATTKRLVAYVQREALRRTFVSVADEVGSLRARSGASSPSTPTPWMRRAHSSHRTGSASTRSTSAGPGEYSRTCSSGPSSMCSAIGTGRVWSRSCRAWLTKNGWNSWPWMWRPYEEAVNAVLPHATIEHRQVPRAALANAALEAVRKEHRSRLTRAQRRRLHDRLLLKRRTT
jgi:hypothetical protein